MAGTEKNKPIKQFRSGSIQIAVWANELDDGIRYSTSIKRRYKDRGGNYHSTDVIFPSDLPHVAFVATQAHLFVASLEQQARDAGKRRDAEELAAEQDDYRRAVGSD